MVGCTSMFEDGGLLPNLTHLQHVGAIVKKTEELPESKTPSTKDVEIMSSIKNHVEDQVVTAELLTTLYQNFEQLIQTDGGYLQNMIRLPLSNDVKIDGLGDVSATVDIEMTAADRYTLRLHVSVQYASTLCPDASLSTEVVTGDFRTVSQEVAQFQNHILYGIDYELTPEMIKTEYPHFWNFMRRVVKAPEMWPHIETVSTRPFTKWWGLFMDQLQHAYPLHLYSRTLSFLQAIRDLSLVKLIQHAYVSSLIEFYMKPDQIYHHVTKTLSVDEFNDGMQGW